jgi:hypothetical protein
VGTLSRTGTRFLDPAQCKFQRIYCRDTANDLEMIPEDSDRTKRGDDERASYARSRVVHHV